MPRNRGVQKEKLPDISRKHPSDAEVQAIFEMLKSAPPPAVMVILATGLVETYLDRLLRERFRRQDDETWAILTADIGPLGNLHSKIVAGYAFDLFSAQTQEHLHVVRRIRNAIAHAKRVVTLEHKLVLAELHSIELPENKRTKAYRLVGGRFRPQSRFL